MNKFYNLNNNRNLNKRKNTYVCDMIKNATSNNNNLSNYADELKHSNSDKTDQYTEIYNKRKETLEKLNKSDGDRDKDFYEKNLEWKKKL